jgi:hypothetical protein
MPTHTGRKRPLRSHATSAGLCMIRCMFTEGTIINNDMLDVEQNLYSRPEVQEATSYGLQETV